MSDAPAVDKQTNRKTTVMRSADGLHYTFVVRYYPNSDDPMNLMAGLPTKQCKFGSALEAQFTLPAQIVAEMFAGVAEAAMAPTEAELATRAGAVAA